MRFRMGAASSALRWERPATWSAHPSRYRAVASDVALRKTTGGAPGFSEGGERQQSKSFLRLFAATVSVPTLPHHRPDSVSALNMVNMVILPGIGCAGVIAVARSCRAKGRADERFKKTYAHALIFLHPDSD